MKEVIFWGGTGQAKVLNEALAGADYKLVAVVDNRALDLSPVEGVPLLIGMEGLGRWLAMREPYKQLPLAVVAVGGARGKERLMLMEALKLNGLVPLSIVHRNAFVANDAGLAEGAQVLAMATVCSHTKIGRATIINTAASVDHDCIIGDAVHVGPGAHLAGEIKIDNYAFVGIGAVILPRVNIGEGAIIGAGAVVTKDVAAYETVVGNPARKLLKK